MIQQLKHLWTYSWTQKPAWSYSVVVGLTGPLIVLIYPQMRHAAGYKPLNDVPRTYPYPDGERKAISGYED
ncbi:hypothetical protein MIR68_001371 [Amoeboaphelidium protococcarum]|nr:hypothetical protein MIR68_007530 [Amoeboaphelidium protococcarum]KAI3640493.1 hypothetical protein MIR68_001371 [Amoeboaphelidium protococcarum]KAI3642549.1 hypothetical protein MP228_012104 [Amoeboaphelidium protococcarum]KAI3645609.1 hypothetical protein MP228_008537 [Amoeboaphelidium protococcarum]